MRSIPDEGPKLGPECVTFVIRDIMSFVHLQEPVQHRTVQIALTESQRNQLRLRYLGKVSGSPVFEEISQVFVDEVAE